MSLKWTVESQSPWPASDKGGVRHKGRVFPAQWRSRWRRDDGLIVDFEGRVVDGAAMADAVHVRLADNADDELRDRGVAGEIRRLPLPSMAAESAGAFALEDLGLQAPAAWRQALGESDEARPTYKLAPVRAALPRRRRASERQKLIEQAAEAVIEAVRNGQRHGQTVADNLSVSRAYAYELIRDAKGAGLLPPTRRGQKISAKDLADWEKKR